MARLALSLFERNDPEKEPSNCIKALLQYVYARLYLGRKAFNSKQDRRAKLLRAFDGFRKDFLLMWKMDGEPENYEGCDVSPHLKALIANLEGTLVHGLGQDLEKRPEELVDDVRTNLQKLFKGETADGMVAALKKANLAMTLKGRFFKTRESSIQGYSTPDMMERIAYAKHLDSWGSSYCVWFHQPQMSLSISTSQDHACSLPNQSLNASPRILTPSSLFVAIMVCRELLTEATIRLAARRTNFEM